VSLTSSRPSLARYEFLIRRLHSLTGLFPVGAFMVVHLFTNLTLLLVGPAMYQKVVYQIHSLGGLLPYVEWTFIFLPILFHGLLGLAIVREGQPNSGVYPYAANIRYTLQRVSGIFALLFIIYHVFHMHGWFHFEVWHETVLKALGGAVFRPYNAASTLAVAMQGVLMTAIYAIGVLACVFHFANGIWTMGITWGAWTSVRAQNRASAACAAIGIGLAAVGIGALIAPKCVDLEAVITMEDKMFEAKSTAGEFEESEIVVKRAPRTPRSSAPTDARQGSALKSNR
jgi:succinate dehydrogenase / fumarate reductase, cytochrome b subunit